MTKKERMSCYGGPSFNNDIKKKKTKPNTQHIQQQKGIRKL